MGIEPTSSAWKAEVLPLNYARKAPRSQRIPIPENRSRKMPVTLFTLVEGVGFEPTKAEPADLQSAPVDRLGTPPRHKPIILLDLRYPVNTERGRYQSSAPPACQAGIPNREVYQMPAPIGPLRTPIAPVG